MVSGSFTGDETSERTDRREGGGGGRADKETGPKSLPVVQSQTITCGRIAWCPCGNEMHSLYKNCSHSRRSNKLPSYPFHLFPSTTPLFPFLPPHNKSPLNAEHLAGCGQSGRGLPLPTSSFYGLVILRWSSRRPMKEVVCKC